MTDKGNLHESFYRETEIPENSERSFGLLFTLVFMLIGLWLFKKQCPSHIYFFIISGLFFLSAFLFPAILKPLNIVWFKFGMLISKIVNPIVLGLLFFVVITPFAFVYRLTNKNPLGLDFEKEKESYWIIRSPDEQSPQNMKNQF